MSDIKISDLGLVQSVGTADELPIVQNGVTVKVTGQEIADSIVQINDLANRNYVDTAINNLIDGAPGMLDTLRELANIANNDPNFYNELILALNNTVNDTTFQGYFDSAFSTKNTGHLVEGFNLYFTEQRAINAVGTDPTFNSVTIVGSVTNSTDAATKDYVDSQVSGTTLANTDSLPEGSANKYFTTVRARSAISAGTGISYNANTGVISATNSLTYTLPTASTSVLGGVKVDGTTITVDVNGVIHGSSTYTLPTASASVLGGVKVDGTTITINNGVISSVGSNSSFSRATVSTTTASLTANSSANATVAVAKGYVLYSIQVSGPAWVTVYSSISARTADVNRAISTDPAPGAGVIAEVITTAAATQLFTPGVFGFSSESSPNSNVQLKIVNNGLSTIPITVTLTYLPLES